MLKVGFNRLYGQIYTIITRSESNTDEKKSNLTHFFSPTLNSMQHWVNWK